MTVTHGYTNSQDYKNEGKKVTGHGRPSRWRRHPRRRWGVEVRLLINFYFDGFTSTAYRRLIYRALAARRSRGWRWNCRREWWRTRRSCCVWAAAERGRPVASASPDSVGRRGSWVRGPTNCAYDVVDDRSLAGYCSTTTTGGTPLWGMLPGKKWSKYFDERPHRRQDF